LVLLIGLSACAGSPTGPEPVTTDAVPGTSPTTPSSPTPSSPAPSSSEASTVIELTNDERRHAGLAPFRASAALSTAAQLHANQMAALQRMEHVLNDGPYPTPADRLAAAGYAWRSYAENIAFNYQTPASVVAGWMGSSGHRANILNASLTEIGAAVARDAQGRPYWAQVFGLPR
jgi:uncharacterized protein YkwD